MTITIAPNLLDQLRSYFLGLNYQTEGVPRKVGQVLVPDNSSFWRAGGLNRLIQAHPNSLQAKVKAAWAHFYKAVWEQESKAIHSHYVTLKRILKIPSSQPYLRNIDEACFKIVDLRTVPNETPDPLPLNAIREQEMPQLIALYRKFVSRFKFLNCNRRSLFPKAVKLALQVIMSPPLGRELIRRIENRLGSDSDEIIQLSQSDQFSMGYMDGCYKICWSSSAEPLYHKVDLGNKNCILSLIPPDYLCFAHELIHMLHHAEEEFRHPPNSTFKSNYTNPEEERTITGTCACHGPSISENSLREQFGDYERHTHLGGCPPDASPGTRFLLAMRSGADGDIERAFREEVPPETVRDIVADFEAKGLHSPISLLRRMEDEGVVPYYGPVRSSSSSSRHPRSTDPYSRPPHPKRIDFGSSSSSSSSVPSLLPPQTHLLEEEKQ